ncbi:hypothetical protein BC938DRAFT_483701, partial [Jimgerdemannia flammicorona]
MKLPKEKIYISKGIICRGKDATDAKQASEAEILVTELKASLENIAACGLPNSNEPPSARNR